MGIFDKAKDLLNQHHDQVDQGLDKAGEFADQKTGGKYGEHIDGAVDQVQGRLDEFSGREPAAGPADPAGPGPVESDPVETDPAGTDPLAPGNPPAGA